MIGFKHLIQAQLLTDELYHADTQDLSQWLIYYISRPLLGTIKQSNNLSTKESPQNNSSAKPKSLRHGPNGQKKDLETFEDLLDNFPMVARQIQPGFEKAFQLFDKTMNESLPEALLNSSATTLNEIDPPSPTADESTPMMDSAELRRTMSKGSTVLNIQQRHTRDNLEGLVMSAIELFQSVDKQQLSLVAEATDLTGSKIERLIEQHMTSHVHVKTVWPIIESAKHDEDHELDNHMKQIGDVDIAQVGIADFDAFGGKRELSKRVTDSVAIFRRMNDVSSPQEMLNILLETQARITSSGEIGADGNVVEEQDEKASPSANMDADTLVSLLLMIVIRSPVRRLHARLMYMRDFNFLTEVESGHAGYALSTFEAVLSYLSSNSRGLRNISRINRKLWQAVRTGDIPEVRRLLDPTATTDTDADTLDLSALESADSDEKSGPYCHVYRSTKPKAHFLDDPLPLTESNLSHVFPFEVQEHDSTAAERPKAKKRVSLSTRSMSSSSVNSFISTGSTIASMRCLINGETTAEQLCQTEDTTGKSILFMAIDSKQPMMLKCLLQMEYLIDQKQVLGDRNMDSATLLIVAVQQGDGKLIDMVFDYVVDHTSSEQQLREYLAVQDTSGRSVAHYCFSATYLVSSIGHLLPWQQKDKNGQTPLFAMCRSYDLSNYHQLAMSAITAAAKQQGKNGLLQLADHVDNRSNTLLHIVNDTWIIQHLLFNCGSDPNASNDRRFTPLMVASKFARLESMRVFFTDPRMDLQARDLRGLTAVEVAKDDEVRNRIDDMVLLLASPDIDGRRTTIARAVLVDDGSIRLVIKSGASSGTGSVTVTTSRRSLADFENLVLWLGLEQPASYLPLFSPFRSPFQITPKPSKQVLRDTQLRLDGFLQTMLSHPSFAKHEMLWEFFLVPDIDARMLAERARRKADIRIENLPQDYPTPLTSPTEMSEIEIFTGHAIDQLHQVQSALKAVIRRLVTVRNISTDVAEAHRIAFKHFADLASFTPNKSIKAVQTFATTLAQTEYSPPTQLLYNIHTTLSSTNALHNTLTTRPHALINALNTHHATLAHYPKPPQPKARANATKQNTNNPIRRSRSPIPLISSLPSRLSPYTLLDSVTSRETREDAFAKHEHAATQLAYLGCELRYTQTTVANELAGWQTGHAIELRGVLRAFAKRMVVAERARLACMRTAVREVLDVSDMAADGLGMGKGKSGGGVEAEALALGEIGNPRKRKEKARGQARKLAKEIGRAEA